LIVTGMSAIRTVNCATANSLPISKPITPSLFS
jgi:hypothetical protein